MSEINYERNYKQEKILKMKENFRLLKEKFQLQNENNELIKSEDKQTFINNMV